MSRREFQTQDAVAKRDMSPAAIRERLASFARDPQCCLTKEQVEEDRAALRDLERAETKE